MINWTTANKKNQSEFGCECCIYHGSLDCESCIDGEYFDFKDDWQDDWQKSRKPPSQKRSLKRAPNRYKWGGPKYDDNYGIELQLTDLDYERRNW
jgi:hypothetical protein